MLESVELPSYEKLVVKVIPWLDKKNGTTASAILKIIKDQYVHGDKNVERGVQLAISKLIAEKILVKGTGRRLRLAKSGINRKRLAKRLLRQVKGATVTGKWRLVKQKIRAGFFNGIFKRVKGNTKLAKKKTKKRKSVFGRAPDPVFLYHDAGAISSDGESKYSPYAELVISAIAKLRKEGGSTAREITQYILKTFNTRVPPNYQFVKRLVQDALNTGVEQYTLTRIQEDGDEARFFLGAARCRFRLATIAARRYHRNEFNMMRLYTAMETELGMRFPNRGHIKF